MLVMSKLIDTFAISKFIKSDIIRRRNREISYYTCEQREARKTVFAGDRNIKKQMVDSEKRNHS